MIKVQFVGIYKKVAASCAELFLLVIAFFASLTIAPLFLLPFSNPHNISNQFNSIGFNPSNNYVMMMVIVIATLALFLGMRQLYQTKYAWVIKLIAIFILVANHFVFNMLHISTGYVADIIYANGPHSLDNFHSGEQLSPAAAFLSGAKPYGDMFFLRGAGVDVIIPALGFILFGKAIGSFLLINHLLMLLTLVGFFGLMALVVKGTLRYVAVITLFYVSNAISLVQIRDIPVWIVMGLVLLLFKKDLTLLQKKITLAAIGVLSSLELYIAIDRGMLLLALAVMLAMLLVVTKGDAANNYTFQPKLWKKNLQASLYVLAGLVVGVGVPALFLGWQSFVAFLKMTFVEIPDYGGLLVSTRFPPLFNAEYLIWGPIIITIATAYLLLKLYAAKPKHLNQLLPYTLLFLFAVLCIKAGANRIHILKMATVVVPLFFIAFVVLLHAFYVGYKQRAERAHLALPIVLLLVSFGVFAQLDFTKLLQQPVYTRHDLMVYKNMPHTADDFWTKEPTIEVKNYIVEHTAPQDYIYTFPSNPAYYYLTNRKNPTRFYESWFADPQPYTNELLASLKNKPPKLIVYEDASWMDAPDTVPIKDRLPEVSDWILKNYTKETIVGGARILEQ